MDRLTNPHVQKQSEEIKEMITNEGLRFIQCYWDEEGMNKQIQMLLTRLSQFQLNAPFFTGAESPAKKIKLLTAKLRSNNIAYSKEWEGLKGIDDFLLARKK